MSRLEVVAGEVPMVEAEVGNRGGGPGKEKVDFRSYGDAVVEALERGLALLGFGFGGLSVRGPCEEKIGRAQGPLVEKLGSTGLRDKPFMKDAL